MTKEQLEFITAYSFAGSSEGLNIPFYKEIVEIDNRAMMAFKGKRSDDVVEALSRISDGGTHDLGLQPAVEHLKKKYTSGGE